jgi:hypothetical protein
VAALGAGSVIGVFQFNHVLDPGRGEADGITLNSFVDHGRGSSANDWYKVSSVGTAVSLGTALDVSAPAKGQLVVFSRILPLYPDTCYAVRVRARGLRPGVKLAVASKEFETTLASLAIRVTPKAGSLSYVFRSEARRGITLIVLAQDGGHALLEQAGVVRLGPEACRSTVAP